MIPNDILFILAVLLVGGGAVAIYALTSSRKGAYHLLLLAAGLQLIGFLIARTFIH